MRRRLSSCPQIAGYFHRHPDRSLGGESWRRGRPRPSLLIMSLNSNNLVDAVILGFRFRPQVRKMESQLSPVPPTAENVASASCGRCSEGQVPTSLVCHCFQVTLTELQVAIEQGGARSLEDLSFLTRAGNGCRGCVCKLHRVLAGLPPNCGRFGLCDGCGCVEALCTCAEG